MADTNGSAPLLLNVQEAAALLGVGKGLVYELVAQDRLPHIKLGRVVRIPRQGLEAWIAQESGMATNGSGAVVDLAARARDQSPERSE